MGRELELVMPSTDPAIAALTPKQREIRLRGSRILDCAFPMVREGGLNAVSMNAIAAAMGCTRGTIYNHFPHKEDILLALATRSVQRRMRLFEFAIGLGKNSRERCAAIGIAAEIYADYMPNEFSIEQITRHDPLWHKTSAERREILTRSEHDCIAMVSRVIEDAIATGDLSVTEKGKSDSVSHERELVERLVFGLWSLVYGGLVLEATGRLVGEPSADESGSSELVCIHQPREAIRRNCNALLDNVNWQPLYNAKSYSAFVRRIDSKIIRHVDVVRESTSLAALERG